MKIGIFFFFFLMRVSQNVYTLRNVVLATERRLKECNQNTVCLCINREIYLLDIYSITSTWIKIHKVQRNSVPLTCFTYNDWIRVPFTVVRKKSLVSGFIAWFLFVKVLTAVTTLNKNFANSSPHERVPAVRSRGLHLDLFQTQTALHSHFLPHAQFSGTAGVRTPKGEVAWIQLSSVGQSLRCKVQNHRENAN